MADRSWMYLRNCSYEEYLGGLKSFIAVAEADMKNHCKSAISCPCVDCENDRMFSTSLHVHAHLIVRGFMDDYKCWNKHGEEGVNDRDVQKLGVDVERCNLENTGLDGVQGLSGGSQDGEPHWEDYEADENYLSEDDLDEIGGNYEHIVDQMEEMLRDAIWSDGYTDSEFEKLKKMMRDAKTPLYPSCKEKYTKLFTSLKLLQLKAAHHITDRGFKALLVFLRDMLPKGNHIPLTCSALPSS